MLPHRRVQRLNSLNGLPLATGLRSPLEFLTSITQKYGDLVHFQIGSRRIFVLNHPDYIKDALTHHHEDFSKIDVTRESKHFLGRGLVTSEGAYHRSQRRLIQPAFHHQQITGHASLIVEHGRRYRERWQDGQIINLELEMRRVTLGIISKLLFGIEAVAEANESAEAVSVLFSRFRPFGKPFAKLTGRLPFAARSKQAEARLDKIIYELIARRRHAKDKQGDMLSVLMDLKNGENNRMSDVEVRDEALTIFLAGHETLANALTWTWYSISQHPHVEAKLHKEIETVIGSIAVFI